MIIASNDRGLSGGVVVKSLVIVAAAALPPFLSGALAVQLRAALGLTHTELGVAIGGYFATAAIASTPLGGMVESIGWRRGMKIGGAATVLSLLGIGWLAQSWLTLSLLLSLAGLGNAISQPAANLALARNVSSRYQGVVFGIKQSAVPLATLAGGVSVPLIALTVGWRWAYSAGAIFAVAALWPLPDHRVPAAPTGSTDAVYQPLAPPISRRPLFLVSVAGGLGAIVGTALGVFLVSTAVESGFSEDRSGLLLALGSVGGIGVRVGSGWAADRHGFNSLRAVSCLLLVGAAGCALISTEHPVGLLLGTVAAFGGGWGWPGLMNLAIVREYRRAPAAATGVTQSGVYLGATTGPPLFGLIADANGIGAAWGFAATAAVVAAAVAWAAAHSLGTSAGPGDGHSEFST